MGHVSVGTVSGGRTGTQCLGPGSATLLPLSDLGKLHNFTEPQRILGGSKGRFLKVRGKLERKK